MPIHRITWNEKHGFATAHNWGCTFKCPVCSYRLRSGANGRPGFSSPKPPRFLAPEEVEATLRSLPIKTVYFMGGEPTTAKELPRLLDFAKNDLGLRTFLGHTNGWLLPLPNLDGANVGLKAWDPKVHLAYTGREKARIFDNFANSFRAGLEMRANVVFVPGWVDLDQVEAIAAWVASLSPEIPFHIMGYIPVPGQPYPRPTNEQMARAVETCQRHLRKVGFSHLTPEQALDLTVRDDRFASRQVAGGM